MLTSTQATQRANRGTTGGSSRDLLTLLTDLISVLYGLTAGVVSASKFLLVDSNKDLSALRDVTVRSILGLGAAQGVSVTITGGTSSTSGNAGGALTFTGGVPGATGVGGAANLVAGAGGATSGAGGAAGVVAGAGTGVGANGGATANAGGAGAIGTTTTAGGVGGDMTSTGGAGGAKTGTGAAAGGAGGLGKIAGGAGGATASSGTDAGGAGGVGRVTGGVGGAASAGTGNGGAGGNVDLVPGTGGASAGGTAGLKGEVTVNGDTKGFIPIGVDYNAPGAVAHIMYIAPRAMRVKSIMGRVRVQGGGGACTANFFKAPSATALGSGTALEASGSFNFVGTADANQTMTLHGTASVLELAAGDSIGYVVTGTATNATGNISITLAPT